MQAVSLGGAPLHKGDEIKIVGPMPSNPVIEYAGAMNKYFNNGKTYRIESLSQHDKNWTVIVAGWSWDPRNITKITENVKIEPKPFIFDETLLDI